MTHPPHPVTGTVRAPAAPQRVGPERAGRRWHEDEAAAPVDLRLALLAAALWSGTAAALLLTPLLPRPAAIAIGGAVLLLVGAGVVLALPGRAARCRTGRVRAAARGGEPVRARSRVVAVGLTGLVAGLAIGGAAVLGAATDPVVTAAAQGRFGQLELVVRAPPAVLPERAPAESVPAVPPPARYRIAAVADSLTVGHEVRGSSATVTVFGAGDAFAALVPGTRIVVPGLLATDTSVVVPGAVLRATGPPTVLAPPPWWQRGAAALRHGLLTRAAQLSGDAAGLAPGLVVGDTSDLEERLVDDARTTGLMHLLAVSGSHFALLCGLVALALRRIGPRTAAAGAAAVVVALVVLVGPQPSVLRAAVMAAVTVLGLLSGRPRSALPAVAGAVVVLLVLDPGLALSAGFAMSVAATAALVTVAPAWSRGLQRRRWPRGWADLVALPAAATAATLPVVVLLSGAVSLVSVPANLVAAPAVAPALVLGVLATLLGPLWGTGADLLLRAAEPFLHLIAGTAHAFAALPQATLPWPAGVAWAIGLAGCLLVLGVLVWRPSTRRLVAALAAGAAVVLVPLQVVPPPGWPPAGWAVVGCEVGQGDAFVVATDVPDTAVVVDTGPDPVLVDRCLSDLGVGTVPLLVVTHLHADHVGGLSGVLAGRSVGTLLVGPDVTEPARGALEVAAADRGIPVVAVAPGNRWRTEGLELEVIGPAGPFRGTDSDENNDSVVLLAQRGGLRTLFTGDIEPEAQRALLAAGVDLRADVLKVPHHGSAKDLPEFLAAVAPQIAMIGVGRGNDYGHPSPVLLQRLAGTGVTEVLRTDTGGDIAVVAGGDGAAPEVVQRGARLVGDRG